MMEMDPNDAQVHYYMAMCHLHGWGTVKDSALATDLIISAAKKGLPAAQELLRDNNVSWGDDV